MADANEWNEARLLKFIADRISESAELEYKGAGALSPDKKAEITKDVSSMANASGGTIIYGIAEYRDAPREHLPERIDPIDSTQFSKEWLDQIIAQIRPRIEGLRIELVQLSTAPNHVAYVVEIPKGATAHQALTMYYHRRYNFQALPMLDHEIRDVMNRRTHPKIEVSAKLVIHERPWDHDEAGRLKFQLLNDSDVLARYVCLVVHVPIKINGQPIEYIYDGVGFEQAKVGGGFKMIFSNHLGTPLFPKGAFNIDFPFKAAVNLKVRGAEPFCELYHYSVFAESMPPLRGEFKFDEILDRTPGHTWIEVKRG